MLLNLLLFWLFCCPLSLVEKIMPLLLSWVGGLAEARILGWCWDPDKEVVFPVEVFDVAWGSMPPGYEENC